MSTAPSKSTLPPRNPVLVALGIPRLRLPGRNMSIFLGTVLGISSMIYYDRKNRRANRQKWKDRVSYLAEETLQPNGMPRKVTVYVAPPPGDHLDVTIGHFTQYVKPVLTAAAIDWELVEAKRQGDIRHQVAEQIRKERRGEGDSRDELMRAVTDGLKYDTEGGVICVGRGAYKEYLHGLNEGWLGPLEMPASPQLEKPVDEVRGLLQSGDDVTQTAVEASKAADAGVVTSQVAEANKSIEEDDGEEKKDTKPAVPKPYISQADYGSAPTPPELAQITSFQPIVYIPLPHILGFLNTPIRTYRFFTKRELADRCGRLAASVALSQSRPFIPRIDLAQGMEEENEWPKKWKETALEKGSEWMQDFVVDDRIAERLRVYQLPPIEDENKPTGPAAIKE
ncbi:mitochondrial import inner membrane translocase subunit Tim54 [Lipomyces chichibuensis]|uniref:mitochondrial import inner membrane translocase subunit Tim54 n=1 Tax=Lipomyces chichibuensis TaxID=1546026 RepID=UPI0033438F71